MLALVGIAAPSVVQLSVGGAKFTVGRLGIVLLLVPALAALLQSGRRFLISDLLACLTALWMIVVPTYVGGIDSATSAVAECMELVGGYFVARAYFAQPAPLAGFASMLKVFAAVAIGFAVLDTLSGRWLVRDALTAAMGGSWSSDAALFADNYRGNMIRASSTFDHPILFGSFCALTAAVLLYAERTAGRRIFWTCLCVVGCLLALSSAATIALAVVLSVYAFDWSLKRYQWRWAGLLGVGSVLTLFSFAVSNNPMTWVISHLTIDPQTGFYRILIWDAATERIAQSPITGHGFVSFGDYLLDRTVDSVWLMLGLRYGFPMIALVCLLNLFSFLPARPHFATTREFEAMRTAFTLVLVTFMFTGLTVHFWNYMWIFWGLCIGVRASLQDPSALWSRVDE
ncbi:MULTISPECIES: O-antigen ligase family protein [unclassified Bradyrhizobium]|uniref:O-antigen ligase family protein n=1 Tax=unclassified Bradyrhizobium TaxID=2631580 RepID=UPI001FF8D699|nr:MULTISPECIES: O-antigen ligase family protein [unclassified Bradyrhizobium]MCK1328790.1 O-antigen ligase family protein [Bradyrhizobium sp. CW9]MCK1693434.1 O-antigen ligase family protein [Bradyrhizobium sp. 144]